MNKELARVVGYIMYNQLLEEKINGSFFQQIDTAITIAERFIFIYPEDHKWEDEDLDWDEAIEKFVKGYIN
jgi:hypothetical protein